MVDIYIYIFFFVCVCANVTGRFTPEISKVNLDRVQEWIDQGRLDPSKPITLRELVKSRCIHGIKDGIKLLARGGKEALKQPVTIIVSRASATAIDAVEAAGGQITTRYYTRHAIKRILSGKTDPYVSLAWKGEDAIDVNVGVNVGDGGAGAGAGAGAEGKGKEMKIGMGVDKPLIRGRGFQYRLPDPTKRSDVEYYRDPAHRGYLSYLVEEGEGPSLFFLPPSKDGKKGKKVGKSTGENRIW